MWWKGQKKKNFYFVVILLPSAINYTTCILLFPYQNTSAEHSVSDTDINI